MISEIIKFHCFKWIECHGKWIQVSVYFRNKYIMHIFMRQVLNIINRKRFLQNIQFLGICSISYLPNIYRMQIMRQKCGALSIQWRTGITAWIWVQHNTFHNGGHGLLWPQWPVLQQNEWSNQRIAFSTASYNIYTYIRVKMGFFSFRGWYLSRGWTDQDDSTGEDAEDYNLNDI